MKLFEESKAPRPMELVDGNSVESLSLADPSRWIAELKWNGWRCVLWQGHLYSKNGKLLDPILPERVQLPLLDTPLDGELVCFNGREKIRSMRLEAPQSCEIIFFDAIIPSVPLEGRKKFLAAAHLDHPCSKMLSFPYSPETYQRLLTLVESAKQAGFSILEGIVLKNLDSEYFTSDTVPFLSLDWIKIRST